MKVPSISIVISAYNAEKYIADCIESILEQTFSDFELIIVDDGSEDRTLEISAKYNDSRLNLISSDHNFIKSLNTGISLARGKYIARMDADDTMIPNRLELQYHYMEENSSVDICGGWMDTFGNNSRLKKFPLNHEEIIPSLLLYNCIANPSTIIRKESLKRFSLYPNIYKQEFIYAEDYRLWVDLAMKGLRFANIPQVLVKYRLSETQNTSKYADPMFKLSVDIQMEYLEFIMEYIAKGNDNLFDFLDQAITFTNKGMIAMATLKNLIYELYRNNLNEQRQNFKT